jgi:hypothetical protein
MGDDVNEQQSIVNQRMPELYSASPEYIAELMLKGDLLGQKSYPVMANIPDSVVNAALTAIQNNWTEQQKITYRSVMASSGQRTTLPHPEEPSNPSATLANTNLTVTTNKWLLDWGVPTQYWDYWKNAIDIQVYEIYPASVMAMGISQDTPAVTWDAGGKRHLAIKPGWLNAGVIAHEQAHNSYALLTPPQKVAFSAVYTPLKATDPLIKLLYLKNTYGLTNDVEGHAEVYRYIGQQMPTQLKQYYPLLF